MRIIKVLALLAAAAGAAPVHADCAFSARRDGAAELAGVARVVVTSGAGDLHITASPDAKRIVARGTACASSQVQLDMLRLEVRRDGDTVYIEAGPRNEGKVITIGNSYAQLDVGIALPTTLPVEARDSSGDFSASGVLRLTLDDSSGDIDLRDIGSAQIKDSSGGIKLTNAEGNVTVTFDGSGDIDLSRIGGNAEVGSDGSGDIRIVGAKGKVIIGADGSGDIVVEDVGGDFTLGNDGSGAVLTRGITGKITVPDAR
ncbi:MAG: DUF4097 family beta strand repeat-containing protein [Steroidobacteraceae bacterium]